MWGKGKSTVHLAAAPFMTNTLSKYKLETSSAQHIVSQRGLLADLDF